MSDSPYVLLGRDLTTTGRTLHVYPLADSSWILEVQPSCCGFYSHSGTTSRCYCGSDEIVNERGWDSSTVIYASSLSSEKWTLWIKFWFGLENAEFAEF